MAEALVACVERVLVLVMVVLITVGAAITLQELDILSGPQSALLAWCAMAIPLARFIAGYRTIKVTAAVAAGVPRSEVRYLRVSDPAAFTRSLQSAVKRGSHHPTSADKIGVPMPTHRVRDGGHRGSAGLITHGLLRQARTSLLWAGIAVLSGTGLGLVLTVGRGLGPGDRGFLLLAALGGVLLVFLSWAVGRRSRRRSRDA